MKIEKKSDYEEYLEKYCTKHRISREEAERHYLVREYKAECERKEAEESDNKTMV